MSRYFFTYITTNLINEKQYVGDHSTNNLNDNYFGSGILLKEDCKKYGELNFKREILEQFGTKKEAYKAQEKYIKKFNTLKPNGYNIHPKGGLNAGSNHTEETKRKLAEKASKRIGIKNSFYGKKHTLKSKQKMSDSHLGKKTWMNGKKHSEESIQKMSISGKKRIGAKNSMFGKKHSEFSKYLMSEKAKIKSKRVCKYCNKEMTIAMHNRWHGENCKIKILKNVK